MKVNHVVEIPQTIDIQTYLLEKNGGDLYQFHGALLHYGDSYGGHYAAVVNIGDRLFEFNDKEVIVLQNENFRSIGRHAMLVFYRRQLGCRESTKSQQENTSKMPLQLSAEVELVMNDSSPSNLSTASTADSVTETDPELPSYEWSSQKPKFTEDKSDLFIKRDINDIEVDLGRQKKKRKKLVSKPIRFPLCQT